MLGGIIIAIYFEIMFRLVGNTDPQSIVDHVLISAPAALALASGAAWEYGGSRSKTGEQLLPTWFAAALALIPAGFVLGNIVLFIYIFAIRGGIE